MRKSSQSIDGFVSRPNRRTIGDSSESDATRSIAAHQDESTIGNHKSQPIITAGRVSRREIDESLSTIDDQPEQPKKKRHLFGRNKNKPPKSKRRKIVGWIIKLIIVAVLAIGAYLGINAILAGTSVFKGNIFDIFQNVPLKADENGRTNVLVFGTSGSVDDQRHEGANLTDTLMVLSIDQEKKNAYMVSLPRDLYVDYGSVCPEGYQGKINSLYECFSESGSKEEAGAKALQKKVTEVTGLKMQYYAHINWAVVIGAVNAVGGVTIKVEGNGYNYYCINSGIPRGGIVDVNMNIKYTPGKHHMNGDQALKFSRARGSAGACGLARGDFDRQANQQKVLQALQKKATSSETLLNIGKVTSLMNALGKNLRTDFATKEVQTLISLTKDIPSDKIVSIDLAGDDANLIGSSTGPGNSSIQIPTAGQYDYTQIKAYIHKKIFASAITKEAAKVAVYNGAGVAGLAQSEADKLEAQGFTISAVDTAADVKTGKAEIYDLSAGKKPETKKKLESILGTKVRSGASPVITAANTDFVIILRKAATSTN